MLVTSIPKTNRTPKIKITLIFILIYIGLSFPSTAQWEKLNGPYGPNINGICSIEDTIYIGTFGGGVFKSINEGLSWQNCSEIPWVENLVEVDNTLYILSQGKLYKSDDFGRNWNLIPITNYNIILLNNIIKYDNKLIICGQEGIFVSSDEGVNWTRTSNESRVVSILSIGSNLFASTGLGKILKSTNGGESWFTVFSSGEIFTSMAYFNNRIFVASSFSILISDNLGESWLIQNNGLEGVTSLYSTNFELIAGSPQGIFNYNNITNIWERLVDNFSGFPINSILRKDKLFIGSKIGGIVIYDDNTWKQSNHGLEFPYATVEAYSVKSMPNKIFASTYSGIFEYNEVENNFTEVNLGFKPGDALKLYYFDNTFYAASGYGLFKKNHTNNTWNKIFNFSAEALHYKNSNLIVGGSNIFKSSDNGANWNQITNFSNNSTYTRQFVELDGFLFSATNKGILRSNDNGDSWNFVNSGLLNINAHSIYNFNNRLFIGTENGIYYSDNNGENWNLVLNININTPTNRFIFVNDFIEHENILIAGINNGEIFYSRNFGINWESMSIGFPEPIFFQIGGSPRMHVTDLEIYENYLYCSRSGDYSSSKGVWRFDLSHLNTECMPISVISHPQNQTFSIGSTINLEVTTSGTPPYTYQWRKNGMDIPNATNATYTTPPLDLSDNGSNYNCFVTNCNGTNNATSNSAVLTVTSNCVPVSITSPPSNQTAIVGNTATFSVTTTGTPPFTYQWRKNGIDIPIATEQTYTTPPLTLADNGNGYSCQISNCNGTKSAESNIALLTVSNNPPLTKPKITLNSANVNFGEVVSILGKKFTQNEKAKLIISSTSGYFQEINDISINSSGEFIYDYQTNTHLIPGRYTVQGIDIKTKTSSSQTFLLNPILNNSFLNLRLTGLKTPFSTTINEDIEVEFQDQMIKGSQYSMIGSKRKYSYSIFVSENGGINWQKIETINGQEFVNKPVLLSFTIKLSSIGENFKIRVQDNFYPENQDISAKFNVVNNISSNIKVTLEWDKSYPTTILRTAPKGIAADGTARIIMNLSKINQTIGSQISNVSVSLNDLNNPGNSKLLGKVKVAIEPNVYSLEANNITTLSANDNTLNKQNYYFWYVAPDDYVGNNPNDINEGERTVDATFTINYVDAPTEIFIKKLTIVRPPLMMVHGIGGDENTFFDFAHSTSNFKQDGRRFKIVDLLKYNSGTSISKNAQNFLTGDPYGINGTFARVILKMRNAGYACNRVDYIGHSMGGLIPRAALADHSNLYFRRGNHSDEPYKNYENGFINKFITIGTPHNGTPWADISKRHVEGLNYLERGTIGGYVDFQNFFNPKSQDIKFINSIIKKDSRLIPSTFTITDALSNMQIDKSKGGIIYPETLLRSHLIAGDMLEGKSLLPYDPTLPLEFTNTISQFKGLSSIVTSIGKISSIDKTLKQGIFDFFEVGTIALKFYDPVEQFMKATEGLLDALNISFFLSDSDFIVSVPSQLASSNTDQLPINTTISDGKVHAVLNNRETNSTQIGNKVLDLLNSPILSSKFGSIPSTPNFKDEENIDIRSSEDINYQDESTQLLLSIRRDNNKFKIVGPSFNSSFNVDDEMNVTIDLKDTVGLNYLELEFQGETYIVRNQAKNLNLTGVFNFPVDINSNYLDLQRVILKGFYSKHDSVILVYDTLSINIIVSERITEFIVDPDIKFLDINEEFYPEYFCVFETFSTGLNHFSDKIITKVDNSNIVYFDQEKDAFIGKNIGETFGVIEYNGLTDTIYFVVGGCTSAFNQFSIYPLDNVSFCGEESIILSAPITEKYMWSTGDTIQEIVVSEPGVYFVTIFDQNGCTSTSKPVTISKNPISTIQASNISFSYVSSSQMTLQWENGDGTNRIVVAKANSPVNGVPIDGQYYYANSNFGSGSILGPDEFVIYNGAGSNVTVRNLSRGVQYHFRIFEYSCETPKYLKSPALENPTSKIAEDCIAPTSQAQTLSFSFVSTQQFTVNWSNGNGTRRVVKINTLNQFMAPANGTDPTANSVYSGSGEQVIYNGNGNSVTVTGLKPNTVYWVRVYEANCEGIYSLYNTSVTVQNPNSQQTVLVPPYIQSFTGSTVLPISGGGTRREVFYNNTNVYGANPPVIVTADGSTNTVFTLKASFITGMGFRITNKQGQIVTNGQMASDPVRYGILGQPQIISHNTMEMAYTHPQLIDDSVLPLRIQLLYHGGLLGLTIPLNFVAASPLPVELSDFDAFYDKENQYNEVIWTTQAERNNAYFVLLRSFQNETFKSIGKIDGAGNSDKPVDYLYLDKDILRSGIYQYQLEQVDFDGKQTYSDIAKVSVQHSSGITTSIYPNPTNGLIFCKVEGLFENLTMTLFDMLGNKLTETQNVTKEESRSTPSLSCEHLSGGVYQVVISVDGEVFQHKVVLIK